MQMDLSGVKTSDLLNELASRSEVQRTVLAEILTGFKLHINKIGEYDTETVKRALYEDLHQLARLVSASA